MRTVLRTAMIGLAGCALVACGDDDGGSGSEGGGAHIVVTTNILGDVVRELVGDGAEVEVLMPPGSDPHDFAPSAQQATALRNADVVVANGLGFEVGLLDTIEAAEEDGVQVVTAADAVDVLALPEHAEQDEHADEDEHEGADPHFFTDPVRMHAAAEHIASELARVVDELGTPAFQDRVDAYLTALGELDAEVEQLLAEIPADRRTLVTNHEVFGYFADRYDFDVLGAVIPGGSTLAEPSGAGLADLAHEIDEAGVLAIFAETSAPTRLAEALAAEGTDVEVVELFSESLGEAGGDGATYLDMVRTNAERIAAALR